MKLRYLSATIFCLILFAPAALAQNGGVKGKVRLENGDLASGVVVTVRDGETDVASGTTDKKGDFQILGLKPGTYSVTFRKANYSTGILKRQITVADRVVELGDRLKLLRDTGTLAFVRGSVFDPDGRSVPGARVELWRMYPDGKSKKITETATGESGEFVFRLSPEAANYRVTVKVDHAQTDSKEVLVDGAEIYRVVPFNLKPIVKD